MPEVYGWREGTLHIWTGAATASGTPLMYVQNTTLTPAWTWISDPALDGTYYTHLGGQRAQINIGVGLTQSLTVPRWAQSATAVHLKFTHSGVNGSAGYVAYTAYIGSLTVNGAANGVFSLTMQAHSHTWSAF